MGAMKQITDGRQVKTMMWSFDFNNARNFVGFFAPLRFGENQTIEGIGPIVDICGQMESFDPF